MPLSERDKRALLIGGAAIVLLLLYLLTRGTGGSEPSSVELVQPSAPPAVAPPPVAMAPPPPAAPVVDASQLKLYGVMGSGAVFGMADGSQRFVAIGRDVVPGVTLRRVEIHHAILAGGGGEIRLGFDGVSQPAGAPAAAPAAAPAEVSQREETTRLRLGLAPRQVNGRISGYTMRPGASLPALSQAGIQPGDIVLSVNGSELDAERLEGLAWQMANSTRVEFEVERGGRRLRLTAPGGRQ
jgi:type II secretory pathway component PulC